MERHVIEIKKRIINHIIHYVNSDIEVYIENYQNMIKTQNYIHLPFISSTYMTLSNVTLNCYEIILKYVYFNSISIKPKKSCYF